MSLKNPLKILGECLNGCSGCEMALLDMGDKFLDLLKMVDLVHLPLLMDSKHEFSRSNPKEIKLPRADLGLVSGGIKTQSHLQVARAVRRSCERVMAFGTCAAYGGIPALANAYGNQDLMDTCFQTNGTDTTEGYPRDLVPELTPACAALDEIIPVDLYLPGCPPHPDHIFKVLTALARNQIFELPEKSVCDSCPAIRQGKIQVTQLKRALDLPPWREIQGPDSQIPCLLEQGFLCMGPVTRDGCGGDSHKPRCILAQVPCRGCYGPVHQQGNQRLAMLNALVSNGINLGSLPEIASLQRFSGAHGRLTPLALNEEF